MKIYFLVFTFLISNISLDQKLNNIAPNPNWKKKNEPENGKSDGRMGFVQINKSKHWAIFILFQRFGAAAAAAESQ